MQQETVNDANDFAWVSPITSKIKGYPFEVELPDGLAINGVVLSDQLTTLDLKARKTKKEDTAPQEVIDQVDTIQKKIHS
jgi:mRNA interferase MazF